jgi:hypothetical protein
MGGLFSTEGTPEEAPVAAPSPVRAAAASPSPKVKKPKTKPSASYAQAARKGDTFAIALVLEQAWQEVVRMASIAREHGAPDSDIPKKRLDAERSLFLLATGEADAPTSPSGKSFTHKIRRFRDQARKGDLHLPVVRDPASDASKNFLSKWVNERITVIMQALDLFELRDTGFRDCRRELYSVMEVFGKEVVAWTKTATVKPKPSAAQAVASSSGSKSSAPAPSVTGPVSDGWEVAASRSERRKKKKTAA